MKGYAVIKFDQSQILARFTPKYSKIQASHITVSYPLREIDAARVGDAVVLEFFGYATDGEIECLAVRVDGESERSDGSFYHLTLSHTRNRKPVQSNELKHKIVPLDEPFRLTGRRDLVLF